MLLCVHASVQPLGKFVSVICRVMFVDPVLTTVKFLLSVVSAVTVPQSIAVPLVHVASSM